MFELLNAVLILAIGTFGIVWAYHLVGEGADTALNSHIKCGQRFLAGARFIFGTFLGVGLALLIVSVFSKNPFTVFGFG